MSASAARTISSPLPGVRVIPWLVLFVILPFGEGGASPEGLLAAHLVFLIAVAVSVREISLDRSLLIASLMVLGTAFLSSVMAPYLFAAWIALIDLAVLLGTLVLGEGVVRRDPETGSWILGGIVFSGLAQSLLIIPSRAAGWGRFAPGTMLNPSHTAAYLSICLWALVALSVGTSKPRPRGQSDSAERSRRVVKGPPALPPALLVTIGAILLAACLLQASRGGLIALAVGGVVFITSMFRGWTRRARTVAVLAALLVILAGGSVLAYRYMTKLDPYQWDRPKIWGVALRVASVYPVLGCGPGVFPHITAPFDFPHEGPVRYAKQVEATHNDTLRIVAETGLVGALAWLMLLAVAGRRAVRGFVGGGPFEAALGAAVCGLIVQSLVENLSSRPAVAYTGGMILAILVARARPIAYERLGFPRTNLGGAMPASPRPEGAAILLSGLGTSCLSDQGLPSEGTGSTGTAIALDKGVSESATKDGGLRSSRMRPSSRSGLSTPLQELVAGVCVYGGLAAIAIVFVIAPYCGHRSFRLFQQGTGPIGRHYQSAVWWNPIQPDYRAALAEAVLAAKAPAPEDLAAGLRSIDEAIGLKPVDPQYPVLKARLARRLLSVSGDASWISLADAAYERAVTLDPLRPLARVERGWMLLDVRRASEARAEAETALAGEPNCFEARRLRAAALFELGRIEEARAEREEARRRHDLLVGYGPANGYEAQVLRWEDAGWALIERRLQTLGRSASE